jgi:hypothetical protein
MDQVIHDTLENWEGANLIGADFRIGTAAMIHFHRQFPVKLVCVGVAFKWRRIAFIWGRSKLTQNHLEITTFLL